MSYGGDEFEKTLKALASDRTTEFGVPGARVELLRTVDGPFSSVRRVSIQTPARTSHAYIKILKPRRPGEDELARIDRMLKREYQATVALSEALRQDSEIGALRPIAFLPAHRALVTEEVPGRPLGELLRQADTITDELLAVAARVGKWVRIYQSVGGMTADVVAIAERRQYLDDRLKLLEGRVLSSADRRAVLDRFDALAREIESVIPAVPIHADLGPMNVIVDARGRVTVLDFTMAKTGPRHHDLSHLYFHLELLAARHRSRQHVFRALQSAMLNGFDPAASAGEPQFRMLLMQHGACHVALLAERRVPVVDRAYRWFLRRRWQTCERMADGQGELRVA